MYETRRRGDGGGIEDRSPCLGVSAAKKRSAGWIAARTRKKSNVTPLLAVAPIGARKRFAEVGEFLRFFAAKLPTPLVPVTGFPICIPSQALSSFARSHDFHFNQAGADSGEAISMKRLDRLIQRARIRMALRFIHGRVRVIDIGAHRGELFTALGSRLEEGFGIEPLLAEKRGAARYSIVGGFFPESRPDREAYWDVVTMLAVLEHIPQVAQSSVAGACERLLRKGGRVIVTVPAPAVDRILGILKRMRLIDGMSLEEHYGFNPGDTVRIFTDAGLCLVDHRHFQFGLNNVYVFEKKSA
jgi:hypothetical protein